MAERMGFELSVRLTAQATELSDVFGLNLSERHNITMSFQLFGRKARSHGWFVRVFLEV